MLSEGVSARHMSEGVSTLSALFGATCACLSVVGELERLPLVEEQEAKANVSENAEERGQHDDVGTEQTACCLGLGVTRTASLYGL